MGTRSSPATHADDTADMEPWVVHEDEDVLAVHKPAGVTTHRSDAHAQDGMHEWVQRQRPGTSLSILHRLDKATSGVLLFGKTAAANRALHDQFAGRAADKGYELLTTGRGPRSDRLRSELPIDGAPAATDLERVASGPGADRLAARPHTGRTHQVRIHAQDLGLPVLGDTDRGGGPAARLFLHAAHLAVDHPDGRRLDLRADRPASFDAVMAGADPSSPAVLAAVAHEARAVLFDPADTDAYVWLDRDHDGLPGVRVERLGPIALVVDRRDDRSPFARAWVDALHAAVSLQGIYVQDRPRSGGGEVPRRVTGSAPAAFEVVELGLRYGIDLEASTTSSGLFLDQRETRRELMTSDLAGRTVLNVFAHTGALSVAAAAAGAETLTLDLSKRYLDWARSNLERNGHDPADHDFIYGDALEWMGRLARKGRRFDVVLVDPPSSSTPRRGKGRWTVERDLPDLVARAVELTAPGGRAYVSTNLRRMRAATFADQVDRGLALAGRGGTVSWRTLPLDHRSGPGDPPYLKAAWIDLDV